MTSSDARGITRIEPLLHALDKVKRLVGIKYKQKSYAGTAEDFLTIDGYLYGILAQDSVDIVPSAVTYDEERDFANANGWADAYGVDYDSLVPVLIEAVKELSDRVEELETGQDAGSDVG